MTTKEAVIENRWFLVARVYAQSINMSPNWARKREAIATAQTGDVGRRRTKKRRLLAQQI